MSDTVTVVCNHPNGITLRNYNVSPGPLGDVRRAPDGEPLTLQFGENKGMPRPFFEKWITDNVIDGVNTLFSLVEEAAAFVEKKVEGATAYFEQGPTPLTPEEEMAAAAMKANRDALEKAEAEPLVNPDTGEPGVETDLDVLEATRQQELVALAATFPRLDGESDDAYLARARANALQSETEQ